MKLSQTLGLEFNDGGSDRLRNWKVARVDLAECPTMSRNRLGVMLVCMEDVGRVSLQSALWGLLGVLADSSVENVWEFRGNLVECVGADAKILGQHFFRSMRDP